MKLERHGFPFVRRLLILAQRDKGSMTEMVVGRPLDEFKLGPAEGCQGAADCFAESPGRLSLSFPPYLACF
jgi:hypothetical protein